MSGNRLPPKGGENPKGPVCRVAISVGELNIVIVMEATSEAMAVAICRAIIDGAYRNHPIIVHRNLDKFYIGGRTDENSEDIK